MNKKNGLALCVALCMLLMGLPVIAEGTTTVIDQGGHEVVLTGVPQRVAIAGLPPTTSFYLQLVGKPETLVGMPAWSVNEPVWLARVFPDIMNTPTVGAGPNFEVEAVLALKPDLIICSTGFEEKYQAFRESGIPTLGLSSTAHGINTLQTAESWLTILGQVFGEQGKAEAVIRHAKAVADKVEERLDGLAEKKRGLMLPDYSENVLEVSNDEYYGGFWCQMGGLENVAKDVEGWNAGMEEILTWNPDVVFLSAFSAYTPSQMVADQAVPGHAWSKTNAGNEKGIFKFPVGLFNWYALSPDAALSLLWQANCSYPDRFADIDMTQELLDYYAVFGIELTAEEASAALVQP